MSRTGSAGSEGKERLFTLSVIQSGLVAAADEMFAVLKRTAMSPIIYEVLDVGTGVTDKDGRLVSSGAGIPTFVGVLDKAVRRILEIHPPSTIADGDLFVTNDPYFGGVTHLSDVVVALPVFAEGRLAAWTATIAHWNDIGGKTPGSMAADASEIHQEGLRLPAVRLIDSGRQVRPVFEIIEANSRLPEFARGDLWAQIAACRRAAGRIRALAEAYGADACEEAIEASFAEGLARSLAGLERLPKGEFRIEEEQDDGAVWRALIAVSQDEFVVDLTGNPEQRAAPYNTSRDGAVISAQMIFKAVSDPVLFANAGSFEPLRVLTEPGTVFHATGSAPHGFYFETRIRLYDMLWRCMANAFPKALPAGHFASICGTVLAGRHPDTGRKFTMVEPQMGGWGASARLDGLDAMYSASHGDTFNCPAEVSEARYGLEVEYKSLRGQAGGCGLREGGRGLSLSYRLRSPAVLSAGYSRSRIPAWGLNGGGSGGTNGIRVVRESADAQRLAFASGVRVEAGDRIVIETAGGGGWGRPE